MKRTVTVIIDVNGACGSVNLFPLLLSFDIRVTEPVGSHTVCRSSWYTNN